MDDQKAQDKDTQTIQASIVHTAPDRMFEMNMDCLERLLRNWDRGKS